MPNSLTIPSTEVIDKATKPYTVYNLTLQTPLRTTVLQKRYSDFTNLNSLLTTICSAPPPVPLPKKGWFKRTVNDAALTEERRHGLQSYIQAIENDEDPRWRNSKPWREFLGLPPLSEGKKKDRRGSLADLPPSMSGNQWLDLHNQLKTLLHEARTLLTRREQATSATAQHEASAGAKKSLVKANTLILRLEEGLKGLASGQAGEKLGEGEVRRRRDLLSRARKEREGLEGVLNAWVSRKGDPTVALATEGQKQGLFEGAEPSSTQRNGSPMPGAFPSAIGGTSRRVLGGPPAKETERTRELDNEGVLQLQKQVMQEQDMEVEDLGKVVRRMKDMGIAINEELEEQGQLLDMLDQDVDRVGGKVNIARKRVGKIK